MIQHRILRTITYTFVISGALFTNVHSARSQEQLPRSMASIGDSITAGALASFTRSDGYNPFVFPKFLYFIAKFGIIRSFHALENPKRSWAAGLDGGVNSHATYLRGMARAKRQSFSVYNVAVTGATSSDPVHHNDIAHQVDAVLNWSEKNLKQGAPDYVTLELGANDLCGDTNAEMTPVTTYGDSIRDGVARLLESNPKSKILIAGIPDVEHLRDVAYNSILTGIGPYARCHGLWNSLKVCKNVLIENDPVKRNEVAQRIADYMHELETITQEANEKFGADHVRFSRAVNAYRFTDAQISIDCFHPNRIGQQSLANVTWADSWWN